MKRLRLQHPSGPLDRSTAWGCVTSNLALPGSGSLLAGRLSGYGQAFLALGGTVLTIVFGVRFLVWGLSNWSRLQDPEGDLVERGLEVWLSVRWALLGLGAFAAGWLWALGTSLGILRRASRPTPAKPPVVAG
jgi:hypothetical protein